MFFLLTILELESSPDHVQRIMDSGTQIILSCIWELSGIGTFEVNFGCTKFWGCCEKVFSFNFTVGLWSDGGQEV